MERLNIAVESQCLNKSFAVTWLVAQSLHIIF